MHVDFIPQGDRTILSRLAQSRRVSARRRKILTTGRRGFHYSGSYPMVFQHSGAQDFDLGGGFHYSGSYPMVFQHSGARRVDLQCPNGNRQTGGVLAFTAPPQKLVTSATAFAAVRADGVGDHTQTARARAYRLFNKSRTQVSSILQPSARDRTVCKPTCTTCPRPRTSSPSPRSRADLVSARPRDSGGHEPAGAKEGTADHADFEMKLLNSVKSMTLLPFWSAMKIISSASASITPSAATKSEA